MITSNILLYEAAATHPVDVCNRPGAYNGSGSGSQFIHARRATEMDPMIALGMSDERGYARGSPLR